jgi:CheY-like chemotaxis protein
MYQLIVEDDARIARLVERALVGAGHRVDVVHDCADGLLQAEGGAYDLIVLDVMLPGMDGLAVASQLRKRGVRTAILMLTARDSVPDRVVGLDAGADDYLTKPLAKRTPAAGSPRGLPHERVRARRGRSGRCLAGRCAPTVTTAALVILSAEKDPHPPTKG